MVLGLLLLVGCQLVGEFTVRALGVPIPGPVLGMALLFAILLVRRHRRPSASDGVHDGHGPHGDHRTPVEQAADGLITHLQLLFIPAGAGVIVYLPELVRSWAPVAGGVVIAWLATLLATAAVALGVLRLQGRGRS